MDEKIKKTQKKAQLEQAEDAEEEEEQTQEDSDSLHFAAQIGEDKVDINVDDLETLAEDNPANWASEDEEDDEWLLFKIV